MVVFFMGMTGNEQGSERIASYVQLSKDGAKRQTNGCYESD